MPSKGRLVVDGGIHETRTAAGHFATGYRSKRFGSKGKPPGSVVVARVGKYWGVFDLRPQDSPQVRFISIEQGKKMGDRWYGNRG